MQLDVGNEPYLSCWEEKIKNSWLVSFFFLVGHNSGLSEDPSYVEYILCGLRKITSKMIPNSN